MSRSLTEIQQEEKQLIKKLNKLQSERHTIEDNVILPELRKKYEGKCFYTMNSYGGDSKGWKLYMKVIEVESITWFKVIKFQTDCNRKFEFHLDTTYESSLEFPLSESKFQSAYDKAILAMNTIRESYRKIPK